LHARGLDLQARGGVSSCRMAPRSRRRRGDRLGARSPPDAALRFYAQVFGAREYVRDDGSIQALGPGPHDVLAFEHQPDNAGAKAGIRPFGFRLVDPADIDAAVHEVEQAGGKLLRRGAFQPGYPYAYVLDPDGYQIEIWYE